jgi:uncharacterized membrane protein (Fun14 family)
MSELAVPFIYQLGTGGIGGFIVGYAFKKLMKLVAIIAGLFFAALIYLGYQGIISINYGKLEESARNLLGVSGQATQWFLPIILHLPFFSTFIIGFLLGMKLG